MIENKILIVLPCFNEENFIDNALGNLDKILEREDVFLLAIDDGSTDNTMNVLKNDNDIKIGDVLECFQEIAIKKSL